MCLLAFFSCNRNDALKTLSTDEGDGVISVGAGVNLQTKAIDSGTMINLQVAADQSSHQNYMFSDFMTATVKGMTRSIQKIHLDFYHCLSQIIFVLKPGNGFTLNDLKVAKVKVVNAITDGTYDLSQKTDSFQIH